MRENESKLFLINWLTNNLQVYKKNDQLSDTDCCEPLVPVRVINLCAPVYFRCQWGHLYPNNTFFLLGLSSYVPLFTFAVSGDICILATHSSILLLMILYHLITKACMGVITVNLSFIYDRLIIGSSLIGWLQIFIKYINIEMILTA